MTDSNRSFNERELQVLADLEDPEWDAEVEQRLIDWLS